jgi:O-antigen ligase
LRSSLAENAPRAAGPRRSHRSSAVAIPRTETGEQGRTLLGLLLSRGLTRLEQLTDRLGRFSLYGGLLLVALPVLRGPGGLGTIADVFLLFSFLCALFLSARGRSIKISVFQIHAIGLGLFSFGIVVATLSESSAPWLSLGNLCKFIFTTSCTFFSCVILIERQSQLRLALGCWVISAAVTSLVALLQLWFGGLVLGADASLLRYGRMAGLSGNPNGLGAVAGMAIAAGLSLAARSERAERILWLALTLLCVAGVMVSVSRAGAVVGAVSLVLWAAMHYRLNREFTYLVAGCCLMVAAVSAFLYTQSGQSSVYDRLSSAVSDPEKDQALKGRLFTYDAALDEALQSPLVGVGLAPEDADVHGDQVHNMFLLVLRVGGLLSLVGICVILADPVHKALKTFHRSRDYQTQVVAVGLLVGTAGMVLSGMAGPLLYQREMWVPAALTFTLQVLVGRRRTRGHRPRSGRRSPTRRAGAEKR